MCLVLLDLSTAFHTVNHNLLLNRQKDRYGFNGMILLWIQSYLTNICCNWGPWGWWGIIIQKDISIWCTSEQCTRSCLASFGHWAITDICRKHAVSFHAYADGQQIISLLIFPSKRKRVKGTVHQWDWKLHAWCALFYIS